MGEESIIPIIDNGDEMTGVQIIKGMLYVKLEQKQHESNFTSMIKELKLVPKELVGFVLDRLGFETEFGLFQRKQNYHHWKMDWKQFDNDDKSISDINAEITNSQILKEKPHLLIILKL